MQTAARAPVSPPTPEALAQAGGLLRAGALVALPTETVYGLAADATNGAAVARIFEAKGRPHFNPLISHVDGLAAAERLGHFTVPARALAEAFWPGPLTLVVPRAQDCPVSELTTAGLDTLALRVPAHPVARAVIAEAGVPLAAPSANPSGRISPTEALHVADGLGARVALILDGGACAVGLESTIAAVTDAGVSLLRPGAITRAMLEAVTGPLVDAPSDDQARPRSPGRLLSHYAPLTPVRLNAQTVAADEALLAFGPTPLPGAKATINLSASGDVTEAASQLFAALRRLDGAGARAIAVMPVPREGLGEAITDRLTRAAAAKDTR